MIDMENQDQTSKDLPPVDHKLETEQGVKNDEASDTIIHSEDESTAPLKIPSMEVQTEEEHGTVMWGVKPKKKPDIKEMNESENLIIQNKEFGKINMKLMETEKEAREKSHHLLQRANAKLVEQEVEVRELNRLILNAKYQAYREAQMQEKKQRAKERKQQEKLLNQMMEMEEQRKSKMQKELKEKRKNKDFQWMQSIIQQIQQNKARRIVLKEEKVQESKLMQQFSQELELAERKELEKKRQEQLEWQKEIERFKIEYQKRRQEEKEQEKFLELRALLYSKTRMAREDELAVKEKQVKKEKEEAVARVRTLQVHAKKQTEEKDELRAKKTQETMEKVWLQKEQARIQKEAESAAKLKQSLCEQMAEKKIVLAAEEQKKREAVEKIKKEQQELNKRECKALEERRWRMLKYAADLQCQLKEKEQTLLLKRTETFEESKRLLEKASQQRARVDAIKTAKMRELKMSGLPDKYLSIVAKKAKVPVLWCTVSSPNN